jgi:hypothetical protein
MVCKGSENIYVYDIFDLVDLFVISDLSELLQVVKVVDVHRVLGLERRERGYDVKDVFPDLRSLLLG